MNNLIRTFGEPDEVVEFGGATEQLISIGGPFAGRTHKELCRRIKRAGWRRHGNRRWTWRLGGHYAAESGRRTVTSTALEAATFCPAAGC
jgi:hypothetical protein